MISSLNNLPGAVLNYWHLYLQNRVDELQRSTARLDYEMDNFPRDRFFAISDYCMLFGLPHEYGQHKSGRTACI